MDFKAGLVVPKTTSQPTIYLARWIDKQWYVKAAGNLILIQLPDVMTTTVFYSTPCNPAHEETVKRTIVKGGFTSTLEWWSPLYDGMKLQGKIVNNVFIITKMYE